MLDVNGVIRSVSVYRSKGPVPVPAVVNCTETNTGMIIKYYILFLFK